MAVAEQPYPPQADHTRPSSERGIATPGVEPPVLASDALLQGAREAVIMHGGERYVLRRTRQNRLLLTK
ncbi:hemin uptake protein HemP [Marinivivus vitaminiproducens]|uniref:hemin uptake protein HemP n=1 Tax=Marinivivus vitaminiproducens TaxID=3035935 RepID=UPI0027A33F82|nr:hemin uptake protein HemP [Geminicoccaceae bacterium SCSIO 64248]